jgi:hypothetical protein
VHFNKEQTDLLGASTEDGRFIYGRVRQFEAFYGGNSHDGDQNLSAPKTVEVDRNSITDFFFQSRTSVVVCSMGGKIHCIDLTRGNVAYSFKTLELPVFCSSFEDPSKLLLNP